MNEYLRDRVLRKLETLSDERIYQVLDYVDFLESRYAQRQAPSSNVFTRFTEGVEDTLRAGRISATTVAETMGLLNKAMGVLSGVAAAGKSVASDVVSAASRAAERAAPPASAPASAPPASAPSSTTPPPAPPETTQGSGGAAA
jgi:hypothetical protein